MEGDAGDSAARFFDGDWDTADGIDAVAAGVDSTVAIVEVVCRWKETQDVFVVMGSSQSFFDFF